MMVDNHINIIGQGLVGRAAFTGNHQWILANNYISDAHPPEVLNEAHLQFSAGMQTIAVIPILPHGVIQLGSATTVMENIGFVNDVKSLILHLGCIPAALLLTAMEQMLCQLHIQSGNDKMTNPDCKKVKSGENPRPRPKDRQMIQDRLKELREIVPNGAKCSIDTLLEKTIKHMLFLQSVTKHVDNLKQTGESKINENFEGGATWALDVGSQSMICPIVVEDLGPPRQMLVKMLCEEQGFLLEIADLIRGLGLTILKGVMETRNGKIWARFAVEISKPGCDEGGNSYVTCSSFGSNHEGSAPFSRSCLFSCNWWC